MECCIHCHYYKPISHFYSNANKCLNPSIYSNFNQSMICINCKNHPNESQCLCYKAFSQTHEFLRTLKEAQIKYHKDLQELIKNCPRILPPLNLNHVIIKSVKNFKSVIPTLETVDYIPEPVYEKASITVLN